MSAVLRPHLHASLREATRVAHAQLDAMMQGGFADKAAYVAYLRGMHAFVACLAPVLQSGLQAGTGWRLPDWQAYLDDDLAFFGVRPLPAEGVSAVSASHALGMLYVLEGSSLGARVLLRQARAAGHGEHAGASFLHAHADGEAGHRWPRFLALLEARDGDGEVVGDACDGAIAAFGLARRCFSRARDDRATVEGTMQ